MRHDHAHSERERTNGVNRSVFDYFHGLVERVKFCNLQGVFVCRIHHVLQYCYILFVLMCVLLVHRSCLFKWTVRQTM